MISTTKDLHIYESGDGGELALLSGDLILIESLYQSIYICLFGGNVEASTLGNETNSQERLDYWANELLFKDKPNKQFNSITEKTLREVTINSSGRLVIQRAVEDDLKNIKNIADLEVNVVILNIDRIEINIILQKKENQPNPQFRFVWDNAKNQVITDKQI